MKILTGQKDGGPESNVRCWGIEIKGLFSILILCFGKGSREAFHTHAFNSISWVLKGGLDEHMIDESVNHYTPSFEPIMTYRDTFHQVRGVADKNWALTFRSPWDKTWKEKNRHGLQTLTNGRTVISTVYEQNT